MLKKITIIFFLVVALAGCKKEYITNNYYTTQVDSVYTAAYYQTVLNSQPTITSDIRPEYLKKGDTVGIFDISNAVTQSDLASGIAILESWGLNVIEADNLYLTDGRYAGTNEQRIAGFQNLIDNKSVKALISTRGGYGAVQIIPFIDFSTFEKNPKWVVGYSDITALHIALNNKAIETVHGPMVANFTDSESVECLRKALFGELEYYTQSRNSNSVNGTATGRLVGGNLTLIYSTGGTIYDLNVKNSILLIEDTGEANYNIDRMLMNLKLSGKLDEIKGVIVGEFTNTTQGDDKTIPEIIAERLGDLNIPIVYGANIGHDTKNMSVYLGRTVTIDVDNDTQTVRF